MGTLNVNRNVSDLFYRYKMPRILAKVEGKGNGIKTVIVNMTEVAKALGRPPTYPTKYFGCELGAQTQFDFKNDRYIVNGSHEAAKLQELLDGFIRKFVLCPECDNPETDLIVSEKKGTIGYACKACGYHGPLNFVHKLNTYILKNPPNLNPALQGSSLTEGKRTKRKKGENGETNGQTNGGEHDESAHTSAGMNGEEGDDDGDWALDVSKEAVRARMLDLTDGAKGMTISDDLELSEKERVDMFYAKVKADRDAGKIEPRELLAEAERLEIKAKAPLILAELLFDEKINNAQVKNHRKLLLHFVHDDTKAQKYLLGGIEQIIALHKDVLMPKVKLILKLFYDHDILEESVLLDWGNKPSKRFVSKEMSQQIINSAESFLKWLKEAEEEEDSSSEDDLEIEYDDRAKSTPLKVQPKQNAAAMPNEENEDDVDIDAI